MLTTIGEFRSRLSDDAEGLVAALQSHTGRYGADEAESWRRSLPKLSKAFQAPSFQPLHLFFGSRGNLALEYQLPAASAWCDVVLLGAHRQRPSVIILELKDWATLGDHPGRVEGLMERQGGQELHPSEQVRGYTEYCRHFHSAVADADAAVHGCVLLTSSRWFGSYAVPPNDQLVGEYPIFSMAPEDVTLRFPRYFAERLTTVDEAFAQQFALGGYRQNRGFVAQIGRQILAPEKQAFTLLDNQRKAFAECRAALQNVLVTSSAQQPRRHVVIVNGPPGSGKSVVAARLWASLVTDEGLGEGDVVFTTTSMSQNSNWNALFKQASGTQAAGGVVRKATAYTPISTARLGALRKRHGTSFLADSREWREHLRRLRALGEPFRSGARNGDNLITIVDEAHALIDPSSDSGSGQFGFATTLGPQAYHIIRCSQVSVFLLDPRQGFRQRENTSIAKLIEWAEELDAAVTLVNLEGSQFRCAGSVEYVDWLDSVFEGDTQRARSLAHAWRSDALLARMDFRIYESPAEMEAELRRRVQEGYSARLLSSFSRRWKTADAARPHDLPAEDLDFCEAYLHGEEERLWSRPWNHVPRGDYSWFVAAPPATPIADDPLCEVGCTYAVRGFDFDYVGVLWLDDLKWRRNRWVVDPDEVQETGVSDLTSAARRERGTTAVPGPATKRLLESVQQAYRILLTRALKGAYLWIPDRETRDYVVRCFDVLSVR